MRNCTVQERLIDAPAGSLEIVMNCPKSSSELPIPYGVICHPHPLFGGTMNNKVVYTLAMMFNQLGAGVCDLTFVAWGKVAVILTMARGNWTICARWWIG